MQHQMISKDSWNGYFDLVSKMAQGRQILVELIGEDVGDQIEFDWDLFEGFTFDRDRDVLYVHMQSAEHPIESPRQIMAQEDGVTKTISIMKEDGLLQIIHFRDPKLIEGRGVV